MAHRYLWEQMNGELPRETQIHHVCENRRCVNVEHLLTVTPREHCTLSPRMPSRQNELKTHCLRGHEFTPENTYVNPRGHRDCKVCRAEVVRRWREKQPAGYWRKYRYAGAI
jgi:hypothetical protein